MVKYNVNRPDLPIDVQDLVQKLLVRNPDKRIGSQGKFDEIKSHDFFNGIDFDNIHNYL